MRNLIHFEFRKLFKCKSFYICMLVSLLLVFLNALLSKSIADAAEISVDPNSNILSFSSNGMLTMILAIFTAIFVTEDFTGGTIKNIYGKGYTRNEVYFAKYIVSLLSTIAFLTVCLLGSFLFSKAFFTGESAENKTFVASILLQFVILIAYDSIFFLISILSGKLGVSIAFNIVGPSIVSLVLSLQDSFLKLDKIKLSSYWLDSCLSSIQSANCDSSSIITSTVVSIVVIVVSTIVGVLINKRKEF